MRRQRSLGVLFLQYFVFSHLEIVPAFCVGSPPPAHTHGSERGRRRLRRRNGHTATRLHGYTAIRLHGYAGQPCRAVQRECLSVVSNVVEFARLPVCEFAESPRRSLAYRHTDIVWRVASQLHLTFSCERVCEFVEFVDRPRRSLAYRH